MRTVRPGVVRASAMVLVAGTLAGVASAPADAAIPSTTELISATKAGLGAAGLSSVGNGADLSAGGRYVVFASGAVDLVKKSKGDGVHVYLRDRDTQTTTRIDPAPGKGGGNALSPAISASGRFVSFTAQGALAEDDTNGRDDVYLRDLRDGTLTRVSVRPDATQTTEHSFNEDLSADGRHVLIRTSDEAFTGPDSGSALLVRNLVTGASARIDVGVGGPAREDENAPIALPAAISPNGRYVAFTSTANNLVSGDDNQCARATTKGGEAVLGNCTDVFRHDRDTDADGVFDEAGATSTTLLASRTKGVDPGNGDARVVGQGAVADDGSVVLTSHAPALGAVDGRQNVFLVPGGATAPKLVGVAGIGASISAEGRYVAYTSAAKNGFDGPAGEILGVWVLDRELGTRELASVNSQGAPLRESAAGGAIAPAGRHLLFSSFDRTMLRANSTKYRQENVFVRDRGVKDLPAGAADQIVTGGEVVTTDRTNRGATTKAPVQTSIVVPRGIVGSVRVNAARPVAVRQFDLFGKRVSIAGPPATPADPYLVTFVVDSSALAGMASSDVQVFRNGDLLAGCAHPTDAVPDACVADRGLRGDDAFATVRTSHLGEWGLGRNRAPSLSGAAATPAVLERPDGEPRAVDIVGIVDPDGEAVRISVTGVTQDEPVRRVGGFGRPDAEMGPPGSGRVHLRAEHDPLGDGRVYVVSFVATDAAGRSSTGAVRVSVARPLTDKPAVDSGQRYSSR